MSALTVFTNKLGCDMYELNEPSNVQWHTLHKSRREQYTRGVMAVAVALAHMTPNDCVAILTAAREHHIGKAN